MSYKKKIISFLLCILMLIPLSSLQSCKKQPAQQETSDTQSSTESIVQSDPQVKSSIDALYVSEVNRTGERILITKDKPYTCSVKSGSDGKWEDTGNLLTNGNIGATNLYAEPMQWAGFTQVSGMEITVDLGGLTEGICEFETTHVLIPEWAINLVPGVTVLVSTDGTNFSQIGKMHTKDTPKPGNLFSYVLSLKEGVKATHIKYKFDGVGGWSFVSEIAAYSYGETPAATELKKLYPDSKMPQKVTTEELWSASDKDFNTKQNLLKGVVPAILCPMAMDPQHIDLNTPIAEAGKLTDGVVAASSNFNDPAYFKMTRGVERTIVFDLTKTSTISEYKFSFYHDEGAALFMPSSFTVYASENGSDWFSIKRVNNDANSQDKTRLVVSGKFEKSYKARFIAVAVPVRVHFYCDEIEIIGKKSITGAVTLTGNNAAVAEYPNKYASPDKLSDVHDVILMYNARELTDQKTEALNNGYITEDESLTYVAYRDKEGKILDYMADSYLYLPFAAFDQSTADGWKKYVDNTFAEGYNLDALESAVEKANQALGRSDYKVKVFLSILRPNLRYDQAGNLKVFGDLDGNGKSEDFTKLEDRIKCIKWQIDENFKRFNQKNYKNLELIGFYWFEEQISYEDENELDMISYTEKYVHELDYSLIWIPYFLSSGYYDWNDLGIDVACMQPNYFWKGYGNNINENALVTKTLGMCVEFEVDSAALGSNFYRKNYKAYLKGGIEHGYMTDTIHMYYISGGNGALYDSYLSKNAFDRSIYDDTYKFMKGTLKIDKPVANTSQSFGCKVNGTLKDQKIAFEGANTYAVLKYSPKYGTVDFKADGSFVYKPLKGFGGEDCFYVYIDNDYETSELIKVNINVG